MSEKPEQKLLDETTQTIVEQDEQPITASNIENTPIETTTATATTGEEDKCSTSEPTSATYSVKIDVHRNTTLEIENNLNENAQKASDTIADACETVKTKTLITTQTIQEKVLVMSESVQETVNVAASAPLKVAKGRTLTPTQALQIQASNIKSMAVDFKNETKHTAEIIKESINEKAHQAFGALQDVGRKKTTNSKQNVDKVGSAWLRKTIAAKDRTQAVFKNEAERLTNVGKHIRDSLKKIPQVHKTSQEYK